MYSNIIIPVDLGHKERLPAMLKAAEAVAEPGAKAILVNVVDPVPAYVASQLPGNVESERKTTAEAALKDMVKDVSIDLETVAIKGHPADVILRLAEARNSDLIVIASHKPGLQDYLIGSTAARVVRHAKCSILVIR
ncbi:MAG: universal stress protein [Rhizobiaceae bacterium]